MQREGGRRWWELVNGVSVAGRGLEGPAARAAAQRVAMNARNGQVEGDRPRRARAARAEIHPAAQDASVTMGDGGAATLTPGGKGRIYSTAGRRRRLVEDEARRVLKGARGSGVGPGRSRPRRRHARRRHALGRRERQPESSDNEQGLLHDALEATPGLDGGRRRRRGRPPELGGGSGSGRVGGARRPKAEERGGKTGWEGGRRWWEVGGAGVGGGEAGLAAGGRRSRAGARRRSVAEQRSFSLR